MTGVQFELLEGPNYKNKGCKEQNGGNYDDGQLQEIVICQSVQKTTHPSVLDEIHLETGVHIIDNASHHVMSFSALVQVLVDGSAAVDKTVACGTEHGNQQVDTSNANPQQARQHLLLAGYMQAFAIVELDKQGVPSGTGVLGAHGLPCHLDKKNDDHKEVGLLFLVVVKLRHKCVPPQKSLRQQG